MNNNGLGAVVITADVVHRHIIVQVRIRFSICDAILSRLCSSSINIDCGLLSGIEAFFLLQADGKCLVVSFQKFTVGSC